MSSRFVCWRLTQIAATLLCIVGITIYVGVKPHDEIMKRFKEDSTDIVIPNSKYQRVQLKSSNISLNVLEVGSNDPKKDLVIFLHGFPETALLSWHHQLNRLSNQENLSKYFFVAPDQRGYNTSDKPSYFWNYRKSALVQDVIDLIDHYNHKSAVVVAHDWGSLVAWYTAEMHPYRIKKLMIMNGPHPTAFRRYLLSNPGQLKNSYYIPMFWVPLFPEALLTKDNNAALLAALNTTKQKAITTKEISLYKQAWNEPGAMTSMLNWYRAIPFPSFLLDSGDISHKTTEKLPMPVRILWGEKDTALQPGLATESMKECENAKLVMLKDSSHWVQHDEPEAIYKELVDFLQQS